MSIYDDTTDGSGTVIYGGHWLAAEPNAFRWNWGPDLQATDHGFYFCAGCLAYCDAMDVTLGDFGELHCSFCGSDDLMNPTGMELED